MREIEMYFETAPDELGPYRRLDLDHTHGYVPQDITIGFPDVRDNVVKRPQANGTADHTKFFGASAVNIKVALEPSMMPVPVTQRKLEDQLRGWMNPRRRGYLVFRERGEDLWRRIYFRGDNVNRTLKLARTEFGVASMTMRAPKGYSESLDLQTKNLPFGGATEAGRAYDLTFDRTYPASSVAGSVEVNNEGNSDAHPVVWIYGPCADFGVENLTTGQVLQMKEPFGLLAGEFLVIDFEAGTILMSGDIANSRRKFLDTSVSEWWTLVDGVNIIRAVAGSHTPPQAHAEIFWHHTYI
jgi:hypothetical protein